MPDTRIDPSSSENWLLGDENQAMITCCGYPSLERAIYRKYDVAHPQRATVIFTH
ncbi:hypothetical protein ACXZ66_01760 [Corynebacterium sp. S7]